MIDSRRSRPSISAVTSTRVSVSTSEVFELRSGEVLDLTLDPSDRVVVSAESRKLPAFDALAVDDWGVRNGMPMMSVERWRAARLAGFGLSALCGPSAQGVVGGDPRGGIQYGPPKTGP